MDKGGIFPDGSCSVRYADHQGPSAREIFIRDFGDELDADPEALAFLVGSLVEKIDNVSAKSIFGPAAFVEIKGAGRIHLQISGFAQGGTELALEFERSLPHLRHRKSRDMVGHRGSANFAEF